MEPHKDGDVRGAPRVRALLPLLAVALALVAVLAPAGQAQSAAESSPEAQALIAEQKAAAKQATREERAAARQERREQRAAERAANEKLAKALSHERTHGALQISCTSVTWTFKEFPNLPGTTITEKLKVNKVSTTTTFTFDGSTGTNVTPIDAPPGSYIIDGNAKWRKLTANGANGGFDIHAKVTCPPRPDMSVEKRQRIEGSGAPFTSAPQTGEVGQTVGYEIVVANPGNVPMTVGAFTDPRCDTGTISGGPAGGVLAPGASSAYLCKHLLNEDDRKAGSYTNTVMLTGTPPSGEKLPSKTSNTVVTEVKPRADPPAEKEQEKTTPTPPATPTPAGGTLGTKTAEAPGKTGVLAFSSGTVPSLKGPQGCVRARFHASIRSAGVASVIFYLDGHKLRRLTAHSAHGGVLSIAVDPTRLRIGAHRLQAKITMIKATTAARAVQASRSLTIVRCSSNRVSPNFTG